LSRLLSACIVFFVSAIQGIAQENAFGGQRRSDLRPPQMTLARRLLQCTNSGRRLEATKLHHHSTLAHQGLDVRAVGLRAHGTAGSEDGRHWSNRDDVSGGCSREPTLSFGVPPGASPRRCLFDVLPIGVRIRVAIASGHAVTPSQVGSIEAVSNEVAVDKK
jgi:hypothetical protein